MNKLMLPSSADKAEVATVVHTNHAALVEVVNEMVVSDQEVKNRILNAFSLLTLCVDEPAGDRGYDRQSGGFSRDN